MVLYGRKIVDPLPTLGGKSQIIDRICRIIEFAHEEFGIVGISDLFAGGNRLLLHLDIVKELEFKIANEIDLGVVNFFRCLQNAYTIDELINHIVILADEYKDEDLFNMANDERRDKNTDFIRSGALTYIVAQYSRAADRQTFCKEKADRGIPIKSLEKFYFLDEVYSEVQLICGDYKVPFNMYKDRSDVLVYLDPPYITTDEKGEGKKTRRRKKMKELEEPKETKETTGYIDKFTVANHEELVNMALTTKNKVIISGYKNAIYERLEANGFHRYFMGEVLVPSSGKGKKEKEYIWCNFEVPAYLVEEEFVE
ncbi:DNA adenine methylase [Geobacillus stearothermophilus]|nr:hypothetical protein GS458_2801 [Geobacillus stearothermophilus]